MKIQKILISIILVIILIIWYYLKKNNNSLEPFMELDIKCLSSEISSVNSESQGLTSQASVESNDCIKEVNGSEFIKYSDPNFDDRTFKSYEMNNHSIKITPEPFTEDIKNIGLYFKIKKNWVGNIMTLSLKSLFEYALDQSNFKDYLLNDNIGITEFLFEGKVANDYFPIQREEINRIMTNNIYDLNFNINKSGNLNISGGPDKTKFKKWDLINDLKSPRKTVVGGVEELSADDNSHLLRYYRPEHGVIYDASPDIIESCAQTQTYKYGPPTGFLSGRQFMMDSDDRMNFMDGSFLSVGNIENSIENYVCRIINTFKNLKTFNTEIPIEPATNGDSEIKFWLNIKLLDPKIVTDPFIEINLNNDIKIHIKKKDIFTNVNENTDLFNHLEVWNINSFEGKVAEIDAWNKHFNENICNYYQCKKNNRDKVCKFDIAKEYAANNSNSYENKEDCIKKCMSNNNDCTVIDCQKKCLECRDITNEQFKKVEKDTYCPWTKISPPNPPDAPKIRGFADEKKINHNYIPIIQLEWRKPISPRCKIERYIIEIDELGIGSNGIKIINVPQTDNNNTFVKEINNLSPQTTYKITVTALGTVNIEKDDGEEELNLISKKSNVLTITTTGENNKILKQTYDYFDNENNNYSNNVASYMYENQTNNSDHILNNINHDDIDIYKSLINL